MQVLALEALTPEARDSLIQLLDEHGPRSLVKHVTHDDPFGIMLAAVDGTTVLGMVEGPLNQGSPIDEKPSHGSPFAYAYQLLIHPQHRRQGIGRALLLAFVEAAAATGDQWIRLKEAPYPDEGERTAFFQAMGLARFPGEDDRRFWGARVADVQATARGDL